MRTISKLLPLVLLASVLSLCSCVNQVKDVPKMQTQDTLSQLKIVYTIPDSNNILTVDFHAIMTPPWQKNYRIDWNFGDSTGMISKFDTSNLTHYFQKFGSYSVTLSVYDTVLKTVLGETKVMLDIENNAIDTNYLHGFTKIAIYFSAFCDGDSLVNIIYNEFQIHWNGTQFSGNYSVPNIIGNIRRSGVMIDSGSFFSNDYTVTQIRVGPRVDGRKIMFKYESIPITDSNAYSLQYSFVGSDLSSKVIDFSDETYELINNYVQFSHVITKDHILWDHQPPPYLTIKFYK
jgi:PKD domain